MTQASSHRSLLSRLVPSAIRRLAPWNAKHLRVVDMRWLPPLWEQRCLARAFEMFDVDCVFDVGANYGQYATMLRRDVGYRGQIVSFEPIPAAVEALRVLAKADPKWHVEAVALSESDGEQTFHVMDDSEMSSLADRSDDRATLAVQAVGAGRDVVVRTETLTSALRRLRADFGFRRPFLKLDTQGYDVRIVRASPDAVREFVGLQSELSVRKVYATSVDYKEAIAAYEDLGFTLSALVPNNAGHFPLLVEIDCIMTRSDLVPALAGARA